MRLARLRDLPLWLEAALALLSSRLRLFFIPNSCLPATRMPFPSTGAAAPLELARVSRALEWWHRRFPRKLSCLPLALAGEKLLRRRGVGARLCIGVRRDERGTFLAHAWLEGSEGPLLAEILERGEFLPLNGAT